MNKEKQFINQWLPLGSFIFFFMAVVTATVCLAPSWGLMDDFGLLKMAREFKADPHNVEIVTQNFITSGMLRPFYYSWAALFYGIFEHSPTGFYVFIAVWNMAAMVFWGLVFYNLFGIRREDRYWTVFFYPLTFFVFTPFWNIFNYLSLQEKFVVFFAPLAIFFFQRLYRKFQKSDLIWLYLCVLCGLMSKATFVYVPCIFFAYAFLDLVLFRYQPKTSWLMVWINGILFAAYTVFTLAFQIQGVYTAKYKQGLAGGALMGKLLGLTSLMKILMLIGFIGFLGLCAYVVFKKRQGVSLGIMIYIGLMAYIVLLLPWGFQSYLVSAIGPLALGALFPLYAWLNAKDGAIKIGLNVLIMIVLCFIFIGNILPSISRMGDIGKAIAFIKSQDGSAQDVYFVPPPHPESADAIGKFTQKNVVYQGDNKITPDLISSQGKNYLVMTDLFSSIDLSGVKAGNLVYNNDTWQVFELLPSTGNRETFRIPFKKTLVQELKVKIREL